MDNLVRWFLRRIDKSGTVYFVSTKKNSADDLHTLKMYTDGKMVDFISVVKGRFFLIASI